MNDNRFYLFSPLAVVLPLEEDNSNQSLYLTKKYLTFNIQVMSINKNHYCVIMAGGIGARFWPMSTTNRPKQFLDILGVGKTLIQMTFDRFTQICPPENIYIVTNEIYRDQVLEQLPLIGETQVLCEPARRNTAPCIAYANHVIKQQNPEAVIVVAPSDHVILKEEVFVANVLDAMKVASVQPWLITLGIVPSRPDTGYGYIQYLEGHTLPRSANIAEG